MNLNKFSLQNKNAIITGGAGLLGFEHSVALLELGATVWIIDINKQKLVETKLNLLKNFSKKNINTKLIDITNEKNLIKFSKYLDSKSIEIDILINNAAIDPKISDKIKNFEGSRFENFSLQDWNSQINVGLTGAFLCSKIFGHKMATNNKGGIILNVASDLSVIAPDNRLYRANNLEEKYQPVKPVVYSVVKTGLIGLTKYLSSYWANKNIRCNALSPGGVYNNQDKVFVNRLQKLIPMGRMAMKEEYRSSVQFLCSDASSYMTGQNIVIDGGRSII